MSTTAIKLGIIFVSFIGVFATRYTPYIIMGNRKNTAEFNKFIKYIPMGVFVDLIVNDVFFTSEGINILENIKIIPLILVVLISIKFKNIGLSVVSGGIIMAAFIYLI